MVRSPQLKEQWELFERQQYRRVFDKTFALRRQLRGVDLHDAYRLMGLACHHQQQYYQATLWFKKACQGSSEPGDWYNLAASATMQGNSQLGAEAFEQVRICQEAAKYRADPGFYWQLCWYASALCDAEEYARLQPLLDELAGVYERLGCTDTTYLYIRRVPFLSCFLALAARCFGSPERCAEGVAWLRAFGRKLDKEGQSQVGEVVQRLRDIAESPAVAHDH